MTRRTLIFLGAAAGLLGACGGGYSEEFRAEFLESCEESSGGKTEYCRCTLEHLEENGPDDEAQITSEDQRKAIQACLEEDRAQQEGAGATSNT